MGTGNCNCPENNLHYISNSIQRVKYQNESFVAFEGLFSCETLH